MPSKRGLHFHVSIHPRGGVNTDAIQLAVQYVSPTNRGIVVSEVSADGTPHLHFAYELVNEAATQDQKRRIEKLYDAYLNHPNGDWGAHAIVVKCHPDFYQLIGGYLAKDSAATLHHTHNLDNAKISNGKVEYEQSCARAKIKRASKSSIPAIVADYHRRISKKYLDALIDDDQYGPLGPPGLMIKLWDSLPAKDQLDEILRRMIDDGYHHLIFEFTDRNKQVLLHYWDNITRIKPENKTPTNDIIDAHPPLPQIQPPPPPPASCGPQGP